MALAPTQPSFLNRWASDVRESCLEAQRKLVITAASLARDDPDAELRIGELGERLSIPFEHLVVDASRAAPRDQAGS